MALENVNNPPTKNPTDPRVQAEKKADDVVYWENQVKSARARRELVQEQKMTENLESPPSAPEPPFKVSGGINLGTIDLQEEQRRSREESRLAQIESQKRLDELAKERDGAREALNNANIQHLQSVLGGQIEQLKIAMQSGSRRDIVTELDAVEQVAQRLGLSRGAADPGGNSLENMIALKKLEQELKREERKFSLEMKRDERMWQLELKKLEQSTRESEAKVEAERNRFAMLASLPEQLGASIAKGMLAKGEAGVAAEAAPKTNQTAARTVEAGENEAGELTCPVCQSQVGIGPTAKQAVCAKCRQVFVIKRTAEATEEAAAA
jgi:hypothetical protein